MSHKSRRRPDPPKNANSQGRLAKLRATIKTILSTDLERHCFIIGICEVLCPLPPRIKPDVQLTSDVNDEYWYYNAGRAVAVGIWLTLICAVIHCLL